jgi:hypothetical protein
MQFKREDIGLYVATALIGGGLGLLAGAFLTARINKKREEEEILEDLDAINKKLEEALDNEGEDPPEQISEFYQNEFAHVMGKLAEAEEDEPVRDYLDEELAKVKLIHTEEEAKQRPVTKTTSHRLSKKDRKELARLTEEYIIEPFQIELIEKGTMTVEELEDSLEIAWDTNQAELDLEIHEKPDNVDYSRQYRLDDKPDMADLLEKPIDDVGPRELGDLLVTVGGRWEILLEPPTGKSELQKRTVYFDPSDESVYTKTRDGGMAPADLRVITSKEVRDIIMPWLLFEEDLEVIYVDDIRNKKTRWYEIVRLKEDDDVH